MAEQGRTILYVDQVGFQRMPDTVPVDPTTGVRLIGQAEKTYALILQDTETQRSYVVPIAENVRKILVESMRKAPLEVVTSDRDPVPASAVHIEGPVAAL